ncbi:MAG: hypothetical protein KatS3mg112_0444 [Thermogutta sp.]|nr:MAG: hypothetical protein KatS3mg112_0444 [Thermogutta sp.]
MESLTEYVLSQWPDQPESGECVLTLLESFLDLDQLEEAKAFLNRLPENSPSRARAELRIGQVLWMQYAKAATSREEGAAREDTQGLLAEAQKYLEQGVQRIRASSQGVTVDYFLEYSVWLLAQLYVNTGRTDDAIKLLEDPTIGPLASDAQQPQRSEFAEVQGRNPQNSAASLRGSSKSGQGVSDSG